MEEISSAVAVPFRLGTLIRDGSAMTTHMEITGIKLIANTASLLADHHATRLPLVSISGADEGCSNYHPPSEVSLVTVSQHEGNCVGENSLKMMDGDESNVIFSEFIGRENGEDDLSSLNGDQSLDNSCSQSVCSDTSNICGEEPAVLGANSDLNSPTSMDIGNNVEDLQTIAKSTSWASNFESEHARHLFGGAVESEAEGGSWSNPSLSTVLPEVPKEKKIGRIVSQKAFELDCVPLWGFTSICGRRPEMEDAVAAVPQFLEFLLGC
ncbi:hypothetical protein L1049_021738 [Liquidambar formosana]|uniref:Uncharacterized protein n=1 Tax=Liquidambar formosana TaxID=63359 RepID=A0AAP0RCH9_LIQFO